MYNKKLSDDKQKTELGGDGEQLVKSVHESKGHTVVLSEDKFDSVKDMTIDGKTCEVKTQIPVITQNCFAVEDGRQYNKVNNADIAIFVEIPYNNKYGVNKTVNIYRLNERKGRKFRTADGRDMRLYPISKMTLIEKIDDEDICEHFANLSNSQV